MNNNPLVTEIRKKRAEILDSYQGDYHAMMNAMKQNQWESGHEVVNLARENRQPAVSTNVNNFRYTLGLAASSLHMAQHLHDVESNEERKKKMQRIISMK